MIDVNCYDDCDFTFEDEVNQNRKSYNKKTKNFCTSLNIESANLIRELNDIKKIIHENLIKANKTDPDNWKKYIVENMDYEIDFIEKKNKHNKIIKKHKYNMSINNIKHSKSCHKLIELYYESIDISKIHNLNTESRYILNYSS